ILDGLDADTHDFLRAVSVCSPVPAALAAQLSGRADADGMLDELCQETALVERTSAGAYRFHPMLRSYLVADLARQRPTSFRELQGVAAHWGYDEGEPVHALRHAERAGDGGLIAALVHRSGISWLLGGEVGPLPRP